MFHDRPRTDPVPAEAAVADLAEQREPTDPFDLAALAMPAVTPAEADPVDAAEQAEVVVFDDELRAEQPEPAW